MLVRPMAMGRQMGLEHSPLISVPAVVVFFSLCF
jgi:hypothetical protein